MNKNNLVRYVYSKANRSPFIFDTYLNSNFSLNMEYIYKNYPITVPIDLNIFANKDLHFPVIRSQEISWRSKLRSNISLDFELFYSDFKNFVVTNVYREAVTVQHLSEPNFIDTIYSIKANADVKFENFDLKAQQFGASFTLIYNPTEKLNAKIYGTYQRTKISGRKDVEFNITYLGMGEVQADNTRILELNSFTNPTKWNEKQTPSFYGGFYINYMHNDHWNFSTDAYMTSYQRFIDYDYASSMSDYTGIRTNYYMDVNSNLVLNAKVSYHINKNAAIYTTIKNILGSHREFGYADQIGTLCLIGLQYEL
jgi:iron complex outermembrane receptor protein